MFSNKLKNKYNYNNAEIIAFDSICNFSISVFDLSYKIDADDLTKKIYDFRNTYPVSMEEYNKAGTNVRAWHSDYRTHQMTNILDDLFEVTKEKIYKTLGMKQGVSPWEQGPKIYNSWINIYEPNNFTLRHMHNNFGLATVYYPYVEKDPTPIIFDNNNPQNYQEIKITPKKNMLLVFHSTLYHRVPKITEGTRISISTNISIERKATGDPFIFQNIGK
jgi:hypothetical protein